MNGALVHTVLLGKLDNVSWLQLESHAVELMHAVDWLEYAFTGENQGPNGTSK